MLRPLSSSMRAAANTPAEPVGACVARFPTGISLPRYPGGSASALHVSRPTQRSLVLRPAWSLSRPGRPVAPECFRQCRYLHHPLRLLPAGATVAGRDSHPLKNGTFPRRTGLSCANPTYNNCSSARRIVSRPYPVCHAGRRLASRPHGAQQGSQIFGQRRGGNAKREQQPQMAALVQHHNRCGIGVAGCQTERRHAPDDLG